jgi:hypothetical protein
MKTYKTINSLHRVAGSIVVCIFEQIDPTFVVITNVDSNCSYTKFSIVRQPNLAFMRGVHENGLQAITGPIYCTHKAAGVIGLQGYPVSCPIADQ